MSRVADLRVDILLDLYASRPHRRTAANITRACKRSGNVRDATETEVIREASYLRSKGLLEARPCEVDQATSEYELTADGTDYLEREGWV